MRLDKSIPIDRAVPEFEEPGPPAAPKTRQQPTLVAEVEELVERAGLIESAEKKPEPVVDGPTLKKPDEERGGTGKAPGVETPGEEEPGVRPAKKSAPPPSKPPAADSPPRRREPPAEAPGAGRRFNGSVIFRLAILSVAVVLIVFVFWWLFLTKPVREREQVPADLPGQTAATGEAVSGSIAADSIKTDKSVEQERVTADEPPVTETAGAVGDVDGEPADEAADGGGAIPKPDHVELEETLDQYANQYLIHVSSFRSVENAQDEAFYLLGWGYPVFIYRADLGSKGMWYRVYVGPSLTREDAMKHKIMLDENRRIKSTRIARVPG